MNNNSNSNRGNNRRRGRGNRQQGGGNQNRIDSRARGNAPQMLDKYRKLAQDAQHNGDRVQAEYYLQFADHYFRVIADSRPRQEEARGQRRDERDFSSEEDGDEDDFEGQRGAREDRNQDRRRDEGPRNDRQRDDRSQERGRDERPREDRPREDRPRNNDRNRSDRQRQPRSNESEPQVEREPAGADSEGGNAYEPADNPFVRPSRPRTRDGGRARRPRNEGETEEMTGNTGEIDAAALPPSLSAHVEQGDAQPEMEAAPTTRKLPPRRRRKPADDAGEGDSLTAVG
ncbi:hypothetical protein GCM10011515_02030 [Tsuneonella deserti]|uniref:DUF4167 domain-containing protein n=1 Tax=Tsuneonella deserti TaxID=2035528 RepID=A0ABQ1RZH2_9SPHN|nr:DUF4167 domain-containing protein [Tsuneonella deserti]GGD85960.1 hypothetical protein GCM10011515_02030 [Tsuneonella deserti]